MDGGIADSLPFEKAIADGCDKLIIISTRERGYRKKPEPAQKLIKMAYGKYTQFCEMMESRAERYNKDAEKLEQLRASGKAFVFYPKKELLIHRTENDPAKLMRLYDHGYRHAQWAAESLQKYLSK